MLPPVVLVLGFLGFLLAAGTPGARTTTVLNGRKWVVEPFGGDLVLSSPEGLPILLMTRDKSLVARYPEVPPELYRQAVSDWGIRE